MVSKFLLKKLERESHGKKDPLAALILVLVGIYLYGNEIGYFNFEIKYFSLIVLIVGVLLFIMNVIKK